MEPLKLFKSALIQLVDLHLPDVQNSSNVYSNLQLHTSTSQHIDNQTLENNTIVVEMAHATAIKQMGPSAARLLLTASDQLLPITCKGSFVPSFRPHTSPYRCLAEVVQMCLCLTVHKCYAVLEGKEIHEKILHQNFCTNTGTLCRSMCNYVELCATVVNYA